MSFFFPVGAPEALPFLVLRGTSQTCKFLWFLNGFYRISWYPWSPLEVPGRYPVFVYSRYYLASQLFFVPVGAPEAWFLLVLRGTSQTYEFLWFLNRFYRIDWISWFPWSPPWIRNHDYASTNRLSSSPRGLRKHCFCLSWEHLAKPMNSLGF